MIVLCSIARCSIFGVPRLPVRPCDERPPAMYGHFCLVPRVSAHDRYYCTSNVKCLFTLQKKAIRLICNADRLAHTNAMFKDMSILKLSEFVKYKTAIVMFTIFHGTLPIQLQSRFTKYSSVYSTRQTKSCVMVQVRTNLKAMCLSVRGVKLWNTLPKNCTSLE